MDCEQIAKYKVVKYQDRYGMIDLLQDCPAGGVFAHVCFSDTDASWYHQKDLEELSSIELYGERPLENEKLTYLNELEGIMRNKFAELRNQVSAVPPEAPRPDATLDVEASRNVKD